MTIGTGNAVGDAALLGEQYAPLLTDALQPSSVLEIKVDEEVDVATLTTATITLTDISSGYTVPFEVSLEYDAGGPVSRIVVEPSEDLEYGHRITLELSEGVLFADGSAVGPLTATWSVEARPQPFLFFDPNWRTLITARCAGGGALDPWQRAYTYTPGQLPQRSWLETADVGADDALTRVTNVYVGVPGSHEQALQAWDSGADGGDDYGLHKELSAIQALGWAWAISGTASYRDRMPYLIEAWVDNFGPADRRYSGNPEDALFYAQAIVKLCSALDHNWLVLAGPLRKRTALWLVQQAAFLANGWAPAVQSTFSASHLDAWIDLAVYTVGRLVGDRRMRLWAWDGSAKPTGWLSNGRPVTALWHGTFSSSAPLFGSDLHYVLEDEQEAAQAGRGFREALQAAWGLALIFQQRGLDGAHEWDTANSEGDTLGAIFTLYADYLDGTTSWETLYPGHTLDDHDLWRAAVTFGLPAAIYKTAKLRDVVDDTWGSRSGPKAEDTFWWMGGDAAYWPASAAVGADSTAPPNVSGASSPAQGATWIEYTWTHSATTDERDIVRYYRIYDGVVLVGTTRHTSWVYRGLTPDTAYTVSIRSVDIAGNEATGTSVGPTSTDTIA